MAVALICIALVASGAPIVATGLVAVASRREDRAWSLGGQPPDRRSALARRIVDFRTEGQWPEPKRRAAARSHPARPKQAAGRGMPHAAAAQRRPATTRRSENAPRLPMAGPAVSEQAAR